MIARKCFPILVFLVGGWVHGTVAGAEMTLDEPQAGLVARNEVLTACDPLCAVVVAPKPGPGTPPADLSLLRSQVAEKLTAAGIQHVECRTGLTPRLVVSIELLAVPGGDRCVYRVQTALRRAVTFSNHRDLSVQAEVWRLSPIMEVVAADGLTETITATALMQVEAFIGAYKAAQRLAAPVAETQQDRPAAAAGQAKGPDVSYSFVASKYSAVFHRPDCRWAQNIAKENLVGYMTRAEALKAGKRPCKSCKP